MDTAFLAKPRWGATSFSAVGGVWSVTVALGAAIIALLLATGRRLSALRESIDAGANAAVLPAFRPELVMGISVSRGFRGHPQCRYASIAPIAARRHDCGTRIQVKIDNGLKSPGGRIIAQVVGQALVPSDILGLQREQFSDGVVPALRSVASVRGPTGKDLTSGSAAVPCAPKAETLVKSICCGRTDAGPRYQSVPALLSARYRRDEPVQACRLRRTLIIGRRDVRPVRRSGPSDPGFPRPPRPAPRARASSGPEC